MVIPRLGAIFLLIGYGFAVSQIGRLMYVTAREGHESWIAVVLVLLPIGVLGLASALLVLWRKPLGRTLGFPFCVLLGIVAIMTFFTLPPFGGFLDDYEQASLDRGVNVPRYLEEQGVTPEQFIEDETNDVRAQGGLGAIVAIVVYAATVLRGGSRRPSAPAPRAGARATG
jgi:hypothetical protein